MMYPFDGLYLTNPGNISRPSSIYQNLGSDIVSGF